jgi:hypothetical protein
MSGSGITEREWFEQWREPSLFFHAADTSMSAVGLPDVFMKRQWNYLLEAWAAGKFATLLAEHNNVEVRLGRKEADPDFCLRTNDTMMPFELTELIEADRKRGKEYYSASQYGRTVFVAFDPHLKIEEFFGMMKKSLKKKAGRSYEPKRHLLLYNNIAFSHDIRSNLYSIYQSASAFENEFESLWIMSGDYAVSAWPSTKYGNLLSVGKQ